MYGIRSRHGATMSATRQKIESLAHELKQIRDLIRDKRVTIRKVCYILDILMALLGLGLGCLKTEENISQRSFERNPSASSLCTLQDGVSRLETILGVESNLIIIDALTLGVAPDRQDDAFACKCTMSILLLLIVDGGITLVYSLALQMLHGSLFCHISWRLWRLGWRKPSRKGRPQMPQCLGL